MGVLPGSRHSRLKRAAPSPASRVEQLGGWAHTSAQTAARLLLPNVASSPAPSARRHQVAGLVPGPAHRRKGTPSHHGFPTMASLQGPRARPVPLRALAPSSRRLRPPPWSPCAAEDSGPGHRRRLGAPPHLPPPPPYKSTGSAPHGRGSTGSGREPARNRERQTWGLPPGAPSGIEGQGAASLRAEREKNRGRCPLLRSIPHARSGPEATT